MTTARSSRTTAPRAAVGLAALALAGGLAGCVTDAVTGQARVAAVRWTAEEERAMGRTHAPNIESEYDGPYLDAEATAYLRELVGEMVALSPRAEEFDFHFKILDSSVPNALALPGGYVYITRGLLRELESEAQFVSVMGHELGHVEHRHSMLNQTRGPLGVAGGALGNLGRNLPIGGRIVGAAGSVIAAPSALLGLRFSRKQELEADERGVWFSAELGYDPREAVRTFELFQRMEAEADARGPRMSILRTHPVNEQRIAHVEQVVARERPEWVDRPRAQDAEADAAFRELVARIRERDVAYELYDDALQRLTGRTPNLELIRENLAEARRLVPDEPLFLILEGELDALEEDFATAAVHFLEAVLIYREHAPGDGHWKPHYYLGLFALMSEQPRAALGHLTLSTELYPMNPAAQLLLGHAHALTGDPDAARAAYDEVLRLTPRDSELRREARDGLKALDAPPEGA